MKLLPRRRAAAVVAEPAVPQRRPSGWYVKNRLDQDYPPTIDVPPPVVRSGNRIPRPAPRPPEVSPFEATRIGLHARAVGWQRLSRPELFVLVALEDGRWHCWSTLIDVARDLDVDRDAMLAALDEWEVVYSDGSEQGRGARQWCRLSGVTYDAEDRSAELARATRFTCCALGGRPLRSRTLVEAAGRLEVRTRSVQTALAALGATEDSRGWRVPELTTVGAA